MDYGGIIICCSIILFSPGSGRTNGAFINSKPQEAFASRGLLVCAYLLPLFGRGDPSPTLSFRANARNPFSCGAKHHAAFGGREIRIATGALHPRNDGEGLREIATGINALAMTTRVP